MELATPEQKQALADAVCNGSVNYLYQVSGGHARFGWRKAQSVSDEIKRLGYSVPLYELRPDVWSPPGG